ncbi:MAG: class I SAM-dependent methyltransferase [Planctomycetota bacterium]
MILLDVEETTTGLFPHRVPEASEAMTPAESDALAAWQASPTGSAVYAALGQHIAELLGLSGGRLLSVGEGEGRLASELASRMPHVQVLGTDLCPHTVEAARQKHAAPNLEFQTSSAYDLEPLGSFDAVVCVFTLHHFEDAARALASMQRVLKPGGQLYVMDLRRDASAGAYFRWLDVYVDQVLPVAGLFRASVNAAYTSRELTELLSGWTSPSVGRVCWGEAAQQAFREVDPAAEVTLPALQLDVDGLWHQAHAWR